MSAGSWLHTPFLVSSLAVTSSAVSSYVYVDVDWTRKIAYLASREPGKCLIAVDFANETNPVLLNTIGSATTPATAGSTCVGVRLYNNGTRLALSIWGANKIEVWDLGADPRALNWSKLNAVTVSGPRRFDLEEVSAAQTRIYVGRTGGLSIIDIAEPAGTGGVTGNYTYAPGGAVNAVTYLGGHSIVASDLDASPIHDVDTAARTLNGALSSATADFTIPWFWGAARSLDGTLAYLSGFGGALLQLGGGGVSLVAKHKFVGGGIMRDATFSEKNGQPILYAIGSAKKIYRWDFSNSAAPVLTHATAINDVIRDGYGIRADAATDRAIVVTNGGMLYIIRTDQLDTASATDFSNNVLY